MVYATLVALRLPHVVCKGFLLNYSSKTMEVHKVRLLVEACTSLCLYVYDVRIELKYM